MFRIHHRPLAPSQRAAYRSLAEAAVWMGGLIALACTDPTQEGLFDLCVFQWMGLERCPGCGLGHAVAFLFRGEVVASFQAHPFGGLALAVLGGRIFTLARDAWTAFRYSTS